MINRLERLKYTVNKYGSHTTRSTYDLTVRTDVGRKSTTKCIYFASLEFVSLLTMTS
jgi:hypothetical protein